MKINVKKLFFLTAVIILVFTITGVNATQNNTDTILTEQSDTNPEYEDSYNITQKNKINTTQEKQIKTAKTVTVTNYTQLYETLNENRNDTCTINLQRGLYLINQQYTPYLYEQSNIIINGNASVIFGSGIYSFIETEGKLTVNNITIKSCDEIFRGHDNSTITLNNSNFTDNNATYNSILYSTGNVKIYNCKFNHNGAQDTAILNINAINTEEKNNTIKVSYHGTLEIKNSTFTKNYNTDKNGCLLKVNNNNTIIQNSSFNQITDSYTINIDSQNKVTIQNSNFTNLNTTVYDEEESEIYQQSILQIIGHNTTNINIESNKFNNITFKSNINTKGSIIRCYGDYENPKTKLSINNNKFTNITINSTSDTESNVEGGIIYVYNMITNITNNTFKTNIINSNVYGGILRLDDDKTINNSFINNTVESNIKNTIIEEDLNNKEVYGGVIFNSEYSNLTTDDYNNTGLVIAEIIENTTTYNEGNLNILGKLEAKIKLNTPKQADTGQNIIINLTVTDKYNNPLNGKAVIKLNGITMTDAKTGTNIIEIINSKGSINITLAGLSGNRSYKLDAVFSKTGYARTENTTYLKINKQTYKTFTLNYNVSSEEKIRINQTLKDNNGNIIYGNTKVAIKLGDRTVKTLTVKDGKLDTTVTVPYLPPGNNKLIITLGENYRYDSKRINNTINIHKQNVTATITKIKAKKGQTITIKATLKNKDTKTNVISGKYIFKINGKTIPLIVNNKEVYTTQDVKNGTAQWNYTIPSSLTAGIYNITLAYNGNTQSNSLKITSEALTIT